MELGSNFQTSLENEQWVKRWSTISLSRQQIRHIGFIASFHWDKRSLVGNLSRRRRQQNSWVLWAVSNCQMVRKGRAGPIDRWKRWLYRDLYVHEPAGSSCQHTNSLLPNRICRIAWTMKGGQRVANRASRFGKPERTLSNLLLSSLTGMGE